MKKYIVFFDVGKGKESHEIWASNEHNAKQMTIGYLKYYLGNTQTISDTNIISAELISNLS